MKLYYNNLEQFIHRLEKEGELVRITEPVSRDLEISEIYFRHARSPGGGKALLFENVENSPFPVLINAFGSFRRLKLAFGDREPDEIAGELAKMTALLKVKPPSSPGEVLNLLNLGSKVFHIPPRKLRFRKAPVQEIVWTGDEIDLDRIPILKSWPLDGGRFVTLGLTITHSLKNGTQNLGMYRLQQLSRNTTAMHWQIHKDGSHFWQEYRKAGRRMPVSVVIGGDPSVIFSATAPMPPGLNELLMAGFLRGKGVPVVRGVTNDLLVPAEAEMILEGYVDPDDPVDEGPFGDHTGYYTPVDRFPIFHLTAITMRKNPVYAATVVGRSPQEDCYLAQMTERLFLPLLQVVAPEVKDQMLPWDGNFHNCAVFALEKHFPYHGRRLMNHLWGFSQMSFARSIVTVDDSVDLHGDGEALLRRILDRVDPVRDVYITEGIVDQLDHSANRIAFGGKLGVDATEKMEGEEGYEEENPVPVVISERERERMISGYLSRLKKAGIVVGSHRIYGPDLKNPVWILGIRKKKGQGRTGSRIQETLKPESDAKFFFGVILIVDDDIDLKEPSLILWRMFGNTEPLRDVLRIAPGPRGKRSVLILDSTAKNRADGYLREWPLENRMDEKTIQRVDEKWKRMFGEDPFPVLRP